MAMTINNTRRWRCTYQDTPVLEADLEDFVIVYQANVRQIVMRHQYDLHHFRPLYGCKMHAEERRQEHGQVLDKVVIFFFATFEHFGNVYNR
jgi:hypothetical protein